MSFIMVTSTSVSITKPSSVPGSCVTNKPISTINNIALGPIPGENTMNQYVGDVAAYIAALLELLPNYANFINQLGTGNS
ncbi:hypothetical protein HDU79_002522, partial [Rhizoclosmatium sp. JEL0117]